MRMEAKTHARIAARSNKTDRYDDVSLKAVAGITRQLFSAEQEHRFDESGSSGHQPSLRFVRCRAKVGMRLYGHVIFKVKPRGGQQIPRGARTPVTRSPSFMNSSKLDGLRK